MKKFLRTLILSGLLVVAPLVHAITVYHQPTPYPKSVLADGATKTPPLVPHITDGWLNNYYPAIKTFQDTDQLKIGGYGDKYLSLIKFNDLEGLPVQVDNAYLYLYSLPRGGANTSQVALWRATSTWNTTVQWGDPNVSGIFETYSSLPPSKLPTLGEGYAYSPSPTENAWYGMWITPFYTGWKNGTYPNHGLAIRPNDGSNNQFDYFVSSDMTNEGKHPVLGLTFTPTLELNMPLPGNLSWLVTVEPGGFDCLGDIPTNQPWPDIAHQGSNYFSIDFSWKNLNASGLRVYSESSNIPVIAARTGRVVRVVPNFQGSLNGNYIVIHHNGGTKESDPGFTTRYLHLKDSSMMVTEQALVVGGQTLAYMGNTGASEGVHLHFGVRYATGTPNSDSGASTIPQLTKVVMEGRLLKSYQTECSMDGTGKPIEKFRYYPSSNRSF